MKIEITVSSEGFVQGFKTEGKSTDAYRIVLGPSPAVMTKDQREFALDLHEWLNKRMKDVR